MLFLYSAAGVVLVSYMHTPLLSSLFHRVCASLSYSLYVCIMPGFQAQLGWLIKSEHVPPAQCFLSITFSLFPSHHSPRLERVSVHVYVWLGGGMCVHGPIPHNWSWYQRLISQEGLTRLLRQPREDPISLHFPDYLPLGIHWVAEETKPWPWKLCLICFSDATASVQWLNLFLSGL